MMPEVTQTPPVVDLGRGGRPGCQNQWGTRPVGCKEAERKIEKLERDLAKRAQLIGELTIANDILSPKRALSMAEFADFNKDVAAQDLLALWGVDEPYELVIERATLNILRRSVPDCTIESIRFVRSAGSHPGFKAGGTKTPDDPSKLFLQELTLPFDLEILVRSGPARDRLLATFVFDCSKLDSAPTTELRLDVHSQAAVEPRASDRSA
jgi:hypothetical protein